MTMHPAPLLAVLPPLGGSELLRTSFTAAPVAVVAVALVAYLGAVHRQNRLHPRHPWPAKRTAAFVGGAAVTSVALFSVIGEYDSTLFWDHMVQHLMLIVVAAILVAASTPLTLVWRATTGGAHRRVTAALRSRPSLVIGHPVTAFVIYGVLIPLTHLTVFFNWAIEYRWVDDVEHFLFLFAGYLFWRQIVGRDPNRYRMQAPMRALLLFVALPVDTFVGLTLNSENHEIFPAFAALHRTWGPSLVMDLHIGGVIMWVGGDVLMMLALIPVVVEWVRREERQATLFDRELEAYFPPPSATRGQPTAGFALGTHSRRTAKIMPGPAVPTSPSRGRPRPTPPASTR